MSDLRTLAHDLAAAAVKVQAEALAITEHAAVNVKNGWRANAGSSALHAPSYPASISYDLVPGEGIKGNPVFEVGPDKTKRQGALGNLIEFGSVHNPPHNDGGRALADEGPKFEAAIDSAVIRALW
jgi:hypothetical protein